MTRTQVVISLLLQFIVAAILGYAGLNKVMSSPMTVDMFTTLGMEPTGRYIIGSLEVIATLLLVTNTLAAVGAMIGISVMLGAIIAHLTVLGASPSVALLAIVLIGCLTIAYIRRAQLPLIGTIVL